MKLYVSDLFKQSITFNGDSWSLIDRGIFYHATSSFKMFMFNVYLKNVYFKNFFYNCNSFVLLQKMLKFFMVFWCNSLSSVVSLFSRQKLCVFGLLKLLIGFLLNALFSGGLKKIYGSIRVSSSQFIIFKPLSYCFKETIGFDARALFASRPLSCLIRRYNKPCDITKEFWEKAIQFHGTFHELKIANCLCQKRSSTGAIWLQTLISL